MSSTDSALDWLLSLRAICTSSPEPISASPDFTDWLHISPTTDSPTATQSTSDFHYSSSPLRDVLCSSRINQAQYPQSSQYGSFDFAGYSSVDKIADSVLQTDNITAIIDSHEAYDVGRSGVSFNEHHRMLSLDSNSTTLINTPSPHPKYYRHLKLEDLDFDRTGPFSPIACSSPSTKFIQDLQSTFYDSYYCDLSTASLPVQTISDISPILRADNMETNENKKKRNKKRRRNIPRTASFAERLRAVPFKESFMSGPESHYQPPGQPLPIEPAESVIPDVGLPPRALLLSPCRLVPASSHLVDSPVIASVSDSPTLRIEEQIGSANAHSDLRFTPVSVGNLSPLTPVPSSPTSPPRLKIILKLKRPAPEPATPVRRSKRSRRSIQIESSPPSPEEHTVKSSSSSPDHNSSYVEDRLTFYSNRTLPDDIEVSSNFPLFYRRFPVSSFYQPSGFNSPCTLFGVSHPGGIYNPPRSSLDLYTPRFVKGKGAEKVGLCPICIEPHERGGEKKKLWLAMKFSAFKYYHMQYAHGISASTGLPFSPPISFRIITRPNPGKKEKVNIQQGKCHKCLKWVAVEGIKDMESKVIELHWWKHAAACHHESTLEGEGNYYEEDDIYSKIQSLDCDAA